MSFATRRVPIHRIAFALLVLYAFSFPFQGAVVIEGLGSVSRLVGMAAFAVGILAIATRDGVRVRAPSLFLVVAGTYILWVVVTYFWSIVPSTTIGEATTYAQLAALVWLVHQFVRDHADLDVLWQAFVLGCTVMVGIGVEAFIGSAGGFRDVGGFNANGFAIVASLAIPMAWGLATRRAHPRLQWLNLAYPVLAMVAVVLGASRGGLVTATIALLVVPATMGRLGWVARLVLFVGLVVAIEGGSSIVRTAFPELQANLERLAEVDEQLTGGTLTGRTNIWAAGVEVFATSPVVGVGMGGFNAAVLPILGEPRSAHNAFLSVAVGAGIIGLLLYLVLVALPLVGVLATPARRVEHLVLYVALLVAMLPTNSEDDKFVWFIFAGLATVRPIVVVVDPQREAVEAEAALTRRPAHPAPGP